MSDEDIRTAQAALWDEARVVTEPGEAAAFTALSRESSRPRRTSAPLRGANTNAVRFD